MYVLVCVPLAVGCYGLPWHSLPLSCSRSSCPSTCLPAAEARICICQAEGTILGIVSLYLHLQLPVWWKSSNVDQRMLLLCITAMHDSGAVYYSLIAYSYRVSSAVMFCICVEPWSSYKGQAVRVSASQAAPSAAGHDSEQPRHCAAQSVPGAIVPAAHGYPVSAPVSLPAVAVIDCCTCRKHV